MLNLTFFAVFGTRKAIFLNPPCGHVPEGAKGGVRGNLGDCTSTGGGCEGVKCPPMADFLLDAGCGKKEGGNCSNCFVLKQTISVPRRSEYCCSVGG